MSLPAQLNYTAEHEWLEDRDSVVRVGVTPYAAEALGDIVYVQVPDVGQQIKAGEACGELESTKSVSDLYAPATGEVVAVNEAVVDDPSLVNADPFGQGWLMELRVSEKGELLTAEQYAELTGGA
ncbi:glycine cleavage system H protein [Saccharopolyspora lacisalsi]|uniref:Glycine cleavage system H protein n=1 Tax=Halosaccharopolyspora lacisalsi TaxID=1000566 RepID=A0A839E040_9PSEU|nr:glycine cleavage system protein GcvH [Halosaccharopolyspora lacisalsi]MBA8825107.1 glycine cleavage system H protein [Halosaccharopolyspora lacisalsi]